MVGDDDDIDPAELAWLLSEAGRQESAEDARRANGGRRPKGSSAGSSRKGMTGKERKAQHDRRQRMLGWAAALTALAGRLSRKDMDRVEASGILPDAFLAELDQQWERAVRDWEMATGRRGGPETWEECLALQAWRYDQTQRDPAPPPRNFPTARYEEPWGSRIAKQVARENKDIAGSDFPLDFQFQQSLKRALDRVGPVKDLKLRSGEGTQQVSEHRGKHSGSGRNPLSDANLVVDKKAGTGAEKDPKFYDYSGSASAPEPKIDPALKYTGNRKG